jgi:hypothetical protein
LTGGHGVSLKGGAGRLDRIGGWGAEKACPGAAAGLGGGGFQGVFGPVVTQVALENAGGFVEFLGRLSTVLLAAFHGGGEVESVGDVPGVEFVVARLPLGRVDERDLPLAGSRLANSVGTFVRHSDFPGNLRPRASERKKESQPFMLA